MALNVLIRNFADLCLDFSGFGSTRRKRLMLARMSLADFVQTKGLGLRFDHLDVSGNDGFEFSGRAVPPRRICCSVRSAKKRSAWFIQEAEGPRDILGPRGLGSVSIRIEPSIRCGAF